MSARVAAREFSRLFAAHGLATHPAEVRRIAGKFCAAGHDLSRVEDFVLAYADPTGEQVVREVARGRTSLNVADLRASGGGANG